MGSRPYKLLTELGQRGAVVEIGAERDEGSTAYLRDLAERHGVPFYSVDIVPQPGVICADGAEFLAGFDEEVQAAYLDNFDFVFPEIEGASFVLEQVEQYRRLGYEMTNDNSRAAHLEQAQLVHERSFVGSVIVIDDTYIRDDELDGKGATAVPWLLDNGWDLVHPVDSGISTGYAYLRRER